MTPQAKTTHRTGRAWVPPTRGLAAAGTALCLALGGPAHALSQDSTSVSEALEADAWFDAGKAWLADGDLERACPALTRSHQVQPGTGALLAMALCHERQGKVLQARAEYQEAAERAAEAGEQAREQAARERVRALDAAIPQLIIEATGETDGLRVSLDGAPLASERLGQAIRVAPGKHDIDVHAPGKRSLHMSVVLQAKEGGRTVHLPPLDVVERPMAPADAAKPPVPPTTKAKKPVAAQRTRSERGLSSTDWVGITTMGLGVVGLGAGTYFALREASDTGPNDDCTQCDADDGDIAALGFAVGGVLLATGALTYFVLGSNSDREHSASTSPSLAASGWILPDSAGAGLSGTF